MDKGLKIKNLAALNYKDGQKIKICPVGDVIGIDGRAYKIDGGIVLASIVKNGLDLVLDENHSYASAVGWFPHKDIEAREDGLYGLLELNADGKDLIENKRYKYLSPVFDLGENRIVVGLDSIGLVNRPNLLNNALNEKNINEEKNVEKDVAVLQSRLNEANTKADGLEKENMALKAKIAEQNKTMREQKIEAAIAAGDLLPNKKEFALSLEDDAMLDNFLAVSKTDSEHLKKKTTVDENKKTMSDAQKEVYAQLGLGDDE